MNSSHNSTCRCFLRAGLYSTAAIAICAPAAPAVQEKQTRPPNIIFFIADDMTREMFNCLPEGCGKNLTPNIDRLAKEGTVLLNQYVVSPVCTPSRYNCLTGRYASRATNGKFKDVTGRNGGQTVVGFNSHITKDNITLPKLLQQAGYKTGMAGKNHVVDVSGLKQFPDFDASAKTPENASKLKINHALVCQAMRDAGFDYAASIYHDNPAFLGLREVAVQNMDWVTEGGVDFIDRYRNEPFFLYFATTIPHAPVDAKRSWNADPLITAEGYLDEPLNVQPPRRTIPDRLKTAGIPLTDRTANMLWLDDSLGALLARLEKYGLMDRTIIFFFTDHGQKAKGTLYQGGIHDPSIVWKKGGFPCGSTSKAPVSNVDFSPTILSLAGVQYDTKQFDGESFLPYLNGEQPNSGRVLYHELGYTRAVRKGNWKYLAVRYPEKYELMPLEERTRILNAWNAERRRMHLSIVTEDPAKPFSHLTLIPGGGDAERSSTGSYPGYYARDQLYNLAIDPNEQTNLASDPEYADTLAEMKQLMRGYVRSLPGTFGEFGQLAAKPDTK
jgi:arylsulfatase A-like enzyme